MTDELDALEKRLREPKEWHTFAGYAITFKDDTPFEAADAITSLRRQLAYQRNRYDEIITQADKRAASLQSSVATLNAQLAAERERVDSIAQESAETLVQAEKWEVLYGEQTRRLGTALVERDAALADARELRELLDSARTHVRAAEKNGAVSASELLPRIDAKFDQSLKGA